MGTRGPVPKRSEERQRRNVTGNVVRGFGAEHVKQPRADSSWHPIAKRLWKAMRESGQSQFYEPSDWAVAFSLMEDLSHYKQGKKRSGQMLQTIMSTLASLLLTEGDRRRVQMELERPGADDDGSAGKVEAMSEWRNRLRS